MMIDETDRDIGSRSDVSDRDTIEALFCKQAQGCRNQPRASISAFIHWSFGQRIPHAYGLDVPRVPACDS